MRFMVPAIACLIALSSAPASAAAIVYSVDGPVGSVGQITGTITTDGSTGIIGAADITAWNLEIVGNDASTNLTNSNSGVFGAGDALGATSTQLLFNFSDPVSSYLLFQPSFGNGSQYACAASTTSGTPCYQGVSAVPVSYNDPSAQFTGQGAGSVLGGNIVIGAAVPEPATWALMLVGFAMIGSAIRGRARARVTVAYA